MIIEIISGSPRKESLTRRVGIYIKNHFETNSSHSIGLIDMQEWSLPPVQTVYSSLEKTPDQFKPIAERVFAADAFILVTPEYNGSYSPALKNFLDHFPKQLHKPFGIVTASPGAMGGMRASQQLLLLVPALFGIASPNMLVVSFVDKKFDAEGNLTDESFQNSINNFTAEFKWLAEKLVIEKVNV